MNKEEIFIRRSRIDAPAEAVFKWHSQPGALERLSPPWDPVRVIERKGGITQGARAVLKMKAGPVPFQWVAAHTDYEENRLFRDMMVKGPLARWIHTHRFEPVGKNACMMEDRIDYALRFYPFGNFFAGAAVQKKLERIFTYRHNTLAHDMAAHLCQNNKQPFNILISGASGVVGSALIPFLTTGGHRVFRLVRRGPFPEKNEVFWDPLSAYLDPNDIAGTDVIIHLAGEHIGQGRWTKKKKEKIIESRIFGTALIAKAAAELDPRPRVLICASAIGYYGNRNAWTLTENDGPGNDFISKVCYEWEKAAEPAVRKGIRVVFLRIGIALTPAGGALARFLPFFQAGLGAKIGAGSQFMSWVGIDDVIGAAYHAILNEQLEGPVNAVSPNPITNQKFTETLGKVLARPTLVSLPETTVKLAFGEMGREVLLSSTRVLPEKLLKSGYRFRNPDLEGALLHLLGK